MSTGGFLKLWRTMKDWEWYSDIPARTLFLHILLHAEWETSRKRGVEVGPGQFMTTTVELAKDNGLSRSVVHRTLSKLKDSGQLDVQSNNHWTLVTVVNWAKWQHTGKTSEQPANNQRTTGGRPPHNHHIYKEEEGKKGRREEGKEKAPGGAIVPDLPEVLDTPRFREAWARWVRHRSEIRKPVKPTMAAAMVRQLEAMGHERAIACIDHTIAMGWQGLREPDPKEVVPRIELHADGRPKWNPRA